MIYVVNCESCVKFNTTNCPYPLHAKKAGKIEHEACEKYSFDREDDTNDE